MQATQVFHNLLHFLRSEHSGQFAAVFLTGTESVTYIVQSFKGQTENVLKTSRKADGVIPNRGRALIAKFGSKVGM